MVTRVGAKAACWKPRLRQIVAAWEDRELPAQEISAVSSSMHDPSQRGQGVKVTDLLNCVSTKMQCGRQGGICELQWRHFSVWPWLRVTCDTWHGVWGFVLGRGSWWESVRGQPEHLAWREACTAGRKKTGDQATFLQSRGRSLCDPLCQPPRGLPCTSSLRPHLLLQWRRIIKWVRAGVRGGGVDRGKNKGDI